MGVVCVRIDIIAGFINTLILNILFRGVQTYRWVVNSKEDSLFSIQECVHVCLSASLLQRAIILKSSTRAVNFICLSISYPQTVKKR